LTTEKPNSAANGYVVGEMDAPEKYENLKAAFGHYQEKIDNLNGHTISFLNDKGEAKKKTILMFLGGDYSFLAENYQIAGASGIDFCLWCRSVKENRKTEALGDVIWGLGETARTQQEIRDEVGVDPVFNFSLDQVAVLPLHLILGITKDLLTMVQKLVIFA